MNDSSIDDRSRFVTVVAWVFIGMSAYLLFNSLLQLLFAHFFLKIFGFSQFNQPLNHPDPFRFNMAAYSEQVLKYGDWFIAGTFTTGVALLISSAGLLKRLNWARISFIAVLILGTLMHLARIWWSFSLSGKFLTGDGTQAFPGFKLMLNFMYACMAPFYLVVCGLFAWIIKKLSRPEIKAEFISK